MVQEQCQGEVSYCYPSTLLLSSSTKTNRGPEYNNDVGIKAGIKILNNNTMLEHAPPATAVTPTPDAREKENRNTLIVCTDHQSSATDTGSKTDSIININPRMPLYWHRP